MRLGAGLWEERQRKPWNFCPQRAATPSLSAFTVLRCARGSGPIHRLCLWVFMSYFTIELENRAQQHYV